MSVDAILWILLPLFVAAGSALLSYMLMQARLEVAVANEREVAARLQAQMQSLQTSFEGKVRAAEEEAKRTSFDGFLADIRVDERRYIREFKSATSTKKSMVVQERLFFRNLPLSNWVEREMTIEEEGDSGRLSQTLPTFETGGPALSGSVGPRLVKGEGESGLLAG